MQSKVLHLRESCMSVLKSYRHNIKRVLYNSVVMYSTVLQSDRYKDEIRDSRDDTGFVAYINLCEKCMGSREIEFWIKDCRNRYLM